MWIVLAVAWREIRSLLRRPALYVATFAVPLFSGAIFWGSSALTRSFEPDQARQLAVSQPSGFVDAAGVITDIPFELHRYFIPFGDEDAAAEALRAGVIPSYFVVAADYRQSGRVSRVSQQATINSASAADTRLFRLLLRANLAGDLQLAQRLDQPLVLTTELQATPRAAAAGGSTASSAALLFGLALALSILNGGGWLVQAVAEEKQNRTIEIVLTSVPPVAVMAGKLIGLGGLGLAQLAFWTILGRGLLGAGSAMLPTSIWIWLLLYFVSGYLFFGGIMLAVGAVGGSIRESGPVSTLLTIPMLMPLWFATVPGEPLAGRLGIVLSLIPFTAPVTILLRLVGGGVPLWQLLASLGLLVAGAAGAVWIAARLFRGTALLGAARPTPAALLRALRVAPSARGR